MGRVFFEKLGALQEASGGRAWCFVPYDQLNDGIGLLAKLPPRQVGIVLVESGWKPAQRKYHKQKLALLLASQRHFALEQAKRGVAVRYLVGDADYAEQLRTVTAELGALEVMEPAERELRKQIQQLVEQGLLVVRPHEGWLTTTTDFRQAMSGKAQWRMDVFYRYIRKRYNWLLDTAGKPIGGKWSHDADNRRPWTGTPPAPEPPRFDVDPITAEVAALVEKRFDDHPGTVRADRIPASLAQVETVWQWTKDHCMAHFGPYEDAMSSRSIQLFHGRLSGLINLHRLLPRRVVGDVLQMELPINSKEGFVRQVTGWREFVRHVHQQTDGLRVMPDGSPVPAGLDASQTLPDVYWKGNSGLQCLDHVVQEVWSEGYSHHINRLMVLANWGTLLGVSPKELSDWFWVAFEDAYDWVVEPNVIGMGTYGVGDLMVTKPYVSGSAYIHKMSDYCGLCPFNPKTNCPMTNMYWDFLRRNESALHSNPRMRIVMSSLRRRTEEKREMDRCVAQHVRETLAQGCRVDPAGLREAVEAIS